MSTKHTEPQGDEAQAETFFEALAGRRSTDAGATAMRAAILTESAALRAADTPDAAAESARRDAQTFAQLVQEGVFTDPQRIHAVAPPRSTPSLFASWRGWLQGLFASRVFYPALATCAAVVCLLVIVPGQMPPDGDEVLRGPAPHSVVVADAEAYAQSLAAELRAAGVQARVVQINDRTWTLTLPASQGAPADAALAVLKQRGVSDVLRLPAEISITRR